MLLHPTCEPIDLPPGSIARLEFVRRSDSRSPVPRFLHFHDVVEIVLFGNAHGRVICDGEEFAVTPGCVFYAPSMRYHDFVADAGAGNWVLIQLDPYAVQAIAKRCGVQSPADGLCLVPDRRTVERLLMLAHWLDDCSGVSATPVEQVVALMLTTIWRMERPRGKPIGDFETDLDRFTPVIKRISARPADAPSLNVAASLCNLSPAYFSRRFSEVFGCGYADYVATYRLHLAARYVASTRTPFSSISYALGFASPSHFSARYKARFGLTPRAYREGLLKPGEARQRPARES